VERCGGLKLKLRTEFNDSAASSVRGIVQRVILIKDNLERKHCCIYLVEDSLLPIGTMEQVGVKQGTLLSAEVEYAIEVEPGVDVAFVLALCLIVIEENCGYKLPSLGVVPVSKGNNNKK
jgi:hypothetical protein